MIGRTNASVGGTSQGNLEVRYWDIDGTLLKTQFVNYGENATPPANPTRTDLTFDEWNISSTNVTSHLDIGATYTTTNGRTIIYLEINRYNIGTAPTLRFNKQNNSTCTIYWGDGTTSTTTSTGSVSIAKSAVYAANGIYKVEIENTSGYLNNDNKTWFLDDKHNFYISKIYIGNHSTVLYTSSVFNGNYRTLTEISINRNTTTTTLPSVSAIFILKGVTIPRGFTNIGIFTNLFNIIFISIPKTVITITSEFSYLTKIDRIIISNPLCTANSLNFAENNRMRTVVLQSGLTILSTNMFYNCYKLTEIVNFPTNITSIGGNSLHYCSYVINTLDLSLCVAIPASALQNYRNGNNIIFPINWTTTAIGTNALSNTTFKELIVTTGCVTIGTSSFATLKNTLKIDLPSSVTTINGNAMINSSNVSILICRATTPPTLGTNALFGTSSFMRIYVPDANVAAYQAAAGWTTYGAQIFPLSSL